MMKFQGVFPALVTPCDGEGRLNLDVLPGLVERLIGQGISGLYIGGSTGESYLLSIEDRKRYLEAVMAAVKGRIPVIASIGVVATEHGIDLAKHAASVGASAISAVPPIYFSFSREEYLRYYEDLAAATELPLVVYNIPAMSGVKFSKEDLERLLSNPKIIGVKHTSYDLFQLQMLIEQYPDKSIFIGHDELYLSALAVGAQAGIGSCYNIMADKFVRMDQLYKEKRMEEARLLQGEINRVVEGLLKVGIFKGIKEVLRLQGFDCGPCRKPFLPLSEEDKKAVYACAVENHLL